MSRHNEDIEVYLDQLLAGLHGDAAAVRRMMAETEAHLYGALSEGEAKGLGVEVAAQEAINRFGPASEVARAWSANAPAQPLLTFVRRLAGQFMSLAGVGLVAIGFSGLVARLMTSLWGLRFVFADPPGTRYPAASCDYWMSIHPHAGNCAKAYLAETMADGLQARYVAGILGVLLLGGMALVRRHRRLTIFARATTLALCTGAMVSVCSAVALLALGVDALRVARGNGAGQWLSGAVIVVPVAIAYTVAFIRTGRRPSVSA